MIACARIRAAEAGGKLAEHAGNRADAEDQPDLALRQAVLGQPHRHERPEAGLHRRQQEAEQAEGEQAFPRRREVAGQRAVNHGAGLNR